MVAEEVHQLFRSAIDLRPIFSIVPVGRLPGHFEAFRYCSSRRAWQRPLKKNCARMPEKLYENYIMYRATEAAARLAYLAPDPFDDK